LVVPAQESLLAAADRSGLDFTSLRLCLASGPAMPADMLHRFEDRFGCIVREEYRLSEISPVGLSDPSEVRKVRSLGRPIDGVELRVVDDQGGEVPVGVAGELQIRGHNVMKGYSSLPEATKTALVEGWLATGDIGTVDEHGHLFIVDEKT